MLSSKLFLSATTVALLLSNISSVSANMSGNRSGESLVELMHFGVNINPKVRAAEAEIAQAKANIKVEEGGYWPSLSISTGPESGDFGYNVTLTQMLYDWGQVDSLVNTATSQMRLKMFSLLETRSEVALEIIEAYIDIVKLNEELNNLKKYAKKLTKLVTLAEQRAAGNFSDSAELSRIQQAINYSQQQRSFFTGEVKAAQWRYTSLLQRRVDILPELPPNGGKLFTKVADPEQISQMILKSPQYMTAVEEVKIAQSQTSEAKASIKPKLILHGQTQRRDIGGSLTNDSSISLRFRMDITNGLSSFRRVDAEAIKIESAKWQVLSVKHELERTFFSNKESFLAFSAQQNAITEQLNQSELLISTYGNQFSAGVRQIEDLLNVEREHYELSNQLVTNKVESYRIPYRVASELGVLTDILLNNKYR